MSEETQRVDVAQENQKDAVTSGGRDGHVEGPYVSPVRSPAVVGEVCITYSSPV
jgi:hypothetical protein